MYMHMCASMRTCIYCSYNICQSSLNQHRDSRYIQIQNCSFHVALLSFNLVIKSEMYIVKAGIAHEEVPASGF